MDAITKGNKTVFYTQDSFDSSSATIARINFRSAVDRARSWRAVSPKEIARKPWLRDEIIEDWLDVRAYADRLR